MILGQTQTSVLYSIPDGAQGTRATLKMMAKIVRDYSTNLAIRNYANDLTMRCPNQDYSGEAECLFLFVRDKIRYLQDVNGVETLQTPDVTLHNQSGDCDDKSTLLASMLESIGHCARFIAVGFERANTFEHVFVETLVGRDWIALETTVNGAPMGWSCLDERNAVAYMRECI